MNTNITVQTITNLVESTSITTVTNIHDVYTPELAAKAIEQGITYFFGFTGIFFSAFGILIALFAWLKYSRDKRVAILDKQVNSLTDTLNQVESRVLNSESKILEQHARLQAEMSNSNKMIKSAMLLQIQSRLDFDMERENFEGVFTGIKHIFGEIETEPDDFYISSRLSLLFGTILTLTQQVINHPKLVAEALHISEQFLKYLAKNPYEFEQENDLPTKDEMNNSITECKLILEQLLEDIPESYEAEK